MTNAAKHLDLIFGVDFHVVLAPPAAQPTPVPTPYVGMVFDPFDYLPFIGATTYISGLPRAQAGTGGMATPSHVPMGGPFGPPLPTHESEVFMGSSTVSVDGDAHSYNGLPVLSCQSVGMPAPTRKKGAPPKSLVLPTSTILSIPAGPPVIIGGPPTISLVSLGSRAALSALGKGLRRLQRGSGRVGKAMRAATNSGQKAGDALAKTLKLGDNGRNAAQRAVCTVTGHPVDVATGKVFTDHVDFELPGPLPFKWERVWYSTSTYRGPLGHGWHHPYDAALYVADDVVLYRTPDGRLVAFPVLGAGESHFDRSERMTLTRGPDGYAVQTGDRRRFLFRDIGRPNGEHVLCAITDPSGNRVELRYDDRDQLAEIVDSAGRRLRLTCDAAGRITSLSAPHPEDIERQLIVARYEYDAAGNLRAAIDAMHQAFRYEYRGALLCRETNRNGLSFQFEYDGGSESARCVRTWGDDGIYDHRLSYDLARNLTTVTNSLGYKTQYEHDGTLVVRVVDARGVSTRSAYDEDHKKIHDVDGLGQRRSYRYDERANLVELEELDGARTQLRYDAHDRVIELIEPTDARWRFAYDAEGRLVARTDPLGHANRVAYAGARSATHVDPLGQATGLDFDDQHNLTATRAPNGAERSFLYDGWGRVTTVIDSRGNTQRRSYDHLSRVVRVDEPDGNVRRLAYDGESNVVRFSDAHTDVTLTYQGMGRLATRTQSGTTVRFEYDTEEQLIGIVNEHGAVYRFELDSIGEVVVEHGFDAIRRAYQRDRAGRVIAVTRSGGAKSFYRHDACGRVRAVEHADGARETYRYRLGGELIEADNDACHVVFDRDPLGRVLRETCGHHWVSSEYDACGRRVRVRSSLGADQHIERDVLGQVTKLEHGAENEEKPFVANFERDLQGLEVQRQLPGSVRARWQRDSLGRPVQHELTVAGRTLRARGYRWAEDDRLRTIIDAQSGPTEYAHDAWGNLASAKHADGVVELRMPDAVGNLFRTEDRKDRKYGPAGQLLEAKGADGRITRYAYDAEGNLIEKCIGDSERWQYRWAADGTLREIERPDGRSVQFAYDPLGRRIQKTFGERTTRWVWDGNVPLHEWVEDADAHVLDEQREPDLDLEASVKLRDAVRGSQAPRGPPEHGTASAPITWLFEPESFAPLGKLVAGRSYAIITDHLGTPNAMLDQRGETVWSAEIGAWGQLRRLEGDRAACPFRWPGQYEDVETGLYYNRFRYYDPEAGGYVSQDPIGLAGGRALYAYPRNPGRSCDPFGLACSSARPRFYVRADGTIIPSTGYRHVSSQAPYLAELLRTGHTPANPKGAYFTFTKLDDPGTAPGILQVPHDAAIRVEFDTTSIADEVAIPRGKWGEADHLEPITADFPQFGSGGATQATTTRPIDATRIVDLRTGEVLYGK